MTPRRPLSDTEAALLLAWRVARQLGETDEAAWYWRAFAVARRRSFLVWYGRRMAA